MTSYRASAGGQSYSFSSLASLLAAASPRRSGDELAGLAAQSDTERVAARYTLADLPLASFLKEAVVPYEIDEVKRLIVDTHDSEAFAPFSSMTVGEFRDWMLSSEADARSLKLAAPGITPEMAAAVSRWMGSPPLSKPTTWKMFFPISTP